MIATELRIGNWMMGNKPFQIKANDIGLAYYHELVKHEPRWQPVKLTEDWLTRLCFRRNDVKNIDQYENTKPPHHMFLLNFYDTFGMVRGNTQTRVHYVHQLQNLYFALTSQELTINEI